MALEALEALKQNQRAGRKQRAGDAPEEATATMSEPVPDQALDVKSFAASPAVPQHRRNTRAAVLAQNGGAHALTRRPPRVAVRRTRISLHGQIASSGMPAFFAVYVCRLFTQELLVGAQTVLCPSQWWLQVQAPNTQRQRAHQ
jgi:hypothetical protein